LDCSVVATIFHFGGEIVGAVLSLLILSEGVRFSRGKKLGKEKDAMGKICDSPG